MARIFSDGLRNARYGNESFLRLTPGKLTEQLKAKIQSERRKLSLAQVINWDDFCGDAIAIPAQSGVIWCGPDDPRVEKYVRRREKMKLKPLQVERAEQGDDEMETLENHADRQFFVTPSNLKDPTSVADGLYRIGKIRSTDIKFKATQIKYKTRPPVVSIMGHVDHGKTTLLDTLRHTNIAAQEAGGITQSIGAFQIQVSGKKNEESDLITFIDTPGHEAFTEMRKSGCSAADIIVLVISLSDGIQPQTREVIEMAKSKSVPLVIAINKIDKGGDIHSIESELQALGVSLESNGGDVLLSKISAKHNKNIDGLLQNIQLQSLMCELYTPMESRAELTIIESNAKHVSGIVRCGSLKKGMWVVCGISLARVEKLLNDKGEEIFEARASTPVAIEGFIVLPKPGNILMEVANKHFANKFVVLMRDVYKAEANHEDYLQYLSADANGKIYDRKNESKLRTGSEAFYNVTIKAASFGQLQALLRLFYMLPEIKGTKLVLNVAEVDSFTDDDIVSLMAGQQPGGVILFGNVKNKAHIAIPTFLDFSEHDIVFHAIDWIKERVVNQLPKERVDVIHMEALCKSVFPASQAGPGGNAGGCLIQKGRLHLAAKNLRIIRKGETVWEGRIKEIRRFKQRVGYVEEGLECGIVLEDAFSFDVGDKLQEYSIEWKEHDVNEIYQRAYAEEEEQRCLEMRKAEDAEETEEDGSGHCYLESILHRS